MPNHRGFGKGGVLLDGQHSSFSIKPGEDVVQKMKEMGYTDQEVSDCCVRIMRGNPHWVHFDKQEQKVVEKVQDDHKKENARKEELMKLKKPQQVEMLLKLGVKKEEVPVFEVDRVSLIMKLEKR